MAIATSGLALVTGVAVANPYILDMTVAENPVHYGSPAKFVHGLETGLDWHDCQTTSTRAIGSADNFAVRYADDICHVAPSYRSFRRAQYAQATLYKLAGYSGGGGSHECELLLRFQITAHNARGYECSVGMGPTGTYAFIVRWEGGGGVFTTLWDPHGSVGSYTNTPTTLADGDVIYASISDTGLITIKQNGLVLGTVTDSTFTDGQPGFGFWPVDGATAANAGWKAWQADSL